MAANRMNRDEFYAKVSPLDADQLRKALWTLYWRGTAQVRERVEDTLSPVDTPKRKAQYLPDPDQVLDDVTQFVSLARDGAYMYGDRRVSRTERSKWRLTFRNLAAQAQSALHAADTRPGERAIEQLIDLACEIRGVDYFHSEDPVEAARFVVSHAAAALWQTMLDQHGFAAFSERAAPQLIRWESGYGWTRRGDGKVAENETRLAEVLEPLLTGPDMWRGFAVSYLSALDAVARKEAAGEGKASRQRSRGLSDADYTRKSRAGTLTAWHARLAAHLVGTDDSGLVDRLVSHRALAGPQVTYLRALTTRGAGDLDLARKLIADCLEELPGSYEFHSFAAEIGAILPPRARQVADERSYAQSLIDGAVYPD
ncbi:MAG TPA: hypothetical protein VHO07_21550 [Streptosporangiaceae bacterium]|jgi:hypothetical protein|nr:hypothetical protein [Streptosporangiaceae bacterium]HEX2822733.1 hypothetical protein [Streptosporangiaceae bacterium]